MVGERLPMYSQLHCNVRMHTASMLIARSIKIATFFSS